MSVCRSCGRPVLWAKTVKGKMQPVDAAPDPKGNVEVTMLGSEYVARAVIDPAAYKGNPQNLHMSHFATCPFADRHRGKAKKK